MSEFERILKSTPGTLSQQWYEDGAAVDPGTVTVGITRADGTILVAAGAATSGSGTAARTYSLTTTHTALLDRLTVTWVSSTKGTLVSYVEVADGFLFSIAEARAIKPLDNTTTYTTAAIKDMRTLVEQALEDACGVAFVPRYELETFSGAGATTTLLKWPKVTAVRSVTIDGTAVSPTSAVVALREGLAYYLGGWSSGYGNVVIGYEHGYTSPPERVRRAALFEARYRLISAVSPTDDRAVRLDTDVGSYALQQPGRGGMRFYLPETDAVAQEYDMTVGVA